MSDSEYVLLDTDVFSYLMKPGDPRADIYKPHVIGKTVGVSFVTVGELLYGASKRKWGEKKVDALKQRLQSVIIVPYDYAVCATYGDLKSKLASSPVDCNDLWIASCAVRHSIPPISNNRKHFEKIPGLVLISEAPVFEQIKSQNRLFSTE